MFAQEAAAEASDFDPSALCETLSGAAALLPMPYSAIVAGVLGLAGTLFAWKKHRAKKAAKEKAEPEKK